MTDLTIGPRPTKTAASLRYLLLSLSSALVVLGGTGALVALESRDLHAFGRSVHREVEVTLAVVALVITQVTPIPRAAPKSRVILPRMTTIIAQKRRRHKTHQLPHRRVPHAHLPRCPTALWYALHQQASLLNPARRAAPLHMLHVVQPERL